MWERMALSSFGTFAVALASLASILTSADATWVNMTVFHTNQANWSAGDLADSECRS